MPSCAAPTPPPCSKPMKNNADSRPCAIQQMTSLPAACPIMPRSSGPWDQKKFRQRGESARFWLRLTDEFQAGGGVFMASQALIHAQEPDLSLLRRFTETGDRDAFAEIVRRYTG